MKTQKHLTAAGEEIMLRRGKFFVVFDSRGKAYIVYERIDGVSVFYGEICRSESLINAMAVATALDNADPVSVPTEIFYAPKRNKDE